MITVELDRHTKDPKPYIYAGNSQGDVFIYQVLNLDEALNLQDEEAPLPEAKLQLVDIILTNEPFVVRQITKVGAQTFAFSTENNKVQVVIHKPELRESAKLKAQLD